MCIELKDAITHLQQLRTKLTEAHSKQIEVINECYNDYDRELEKRIKEMCSHISA